MVFQENERMFEEVEGNVGVPEGGTKWTGGTGLNNRRGDSRTAPTTVSLY